MGYNILLTCVIALFICMTVRGYKKGFLRIAVYFAGMFIIIIAVKRLSPFVSDFIINNTETKERISNKITEAFAEVNSKYDNTIKVNQERTIRLYEMPDILKQSLIDNNTEEVYEQMIVSVFEQYVSSFLANKAIGAMSFAILFIVFIIAFKVVLRAVDLISKIPIIHGLNKIAGAFLGFIEALILVWVFFFIMLMFVGGPFGDSVLAMVADSKFLSLLFNSNMLFRNF